MSKKPESPKPDNVKRDLTPLVLTDEDLDALAVITEADILHAQQAARKLLPPKYKNLLQAEEVDDDTPAA